jgi:hypothetical protein
MTTNFKGGSATTSFPASGRLSGRTKEFLETQLQFAAFLEGKEEVVAFPTRLQAMLRKESVQRPLVVRWSPDGRAFFVDDEEQFVAGILPLYNFQQTAMATFEAITTSF